jgi:hypothetical protein
LFNSLDDIYKKVGKKARQKGQGHMLQSVIILGFYPLKLIFANNFPRKRFVVFLVDATSLLKKNWHNTTRGSGPNH